MFFSTDVNQAGGFLPIVWDAPGSGLEAAEAVSLVTDYLHFGPETADSLTVCHSEELRRSHSLLCHLKQQPDTQASSVRPFMVAARTSQFSGFDNDGISRMTPIT